MPEMSEPKIEPLDENKMSLIWYFAIGAMMNPLSIRYRGINPLESIPAEIIDYKLGFFGDMGFASAIYHEGSSFHGVLHKLSNEDILN